MEVAGAPRSRSTNSTSRSSRSTKIELRRGDILQTNADVCVSSVHRSKDLRKFTLSRHVLSVCGRQVQFELQKSKDGNMEIGDVGLTSAGSCRNIKQLMFLCLRQWQPGNSEILLQSIRECLELAAANGHRSISFPALGMGGLKYPPQEVARVLIEAVALYNTQFHQGQQEDEASQSILETVYIVLMDEETDAVKAFLQFCAQGSTDMQTSMPMNDARPADGHQGTAKRNNNSSMVLSSSSQDTLNKLASAAVSLYSGHQLTQQYDPFHFNVQTTGGSKSVGIQMGANIDISLFTETIPKALVAFLSVIASKKK